MRFSMIPRFQRSKAATHRARKSGRRTQLKFEPLEDRRMLSVSWPASGGPMALEVLGTYESGVFDGSAAEIVAHDPGSQRLFVTNAEEQTVNVLDVSDPTNPTAVVGVDPIDISGIGDTATSVAVHGGVVAVAVTADPETDPGHVAFFDTDGNWLNTVQVGVLPDMIIFTPDGTKVLTANEGQPSEDYTIDPEGSVSIVDISGGVASATVTTASFTSFNGQEDALRAKGVRIFAPGASAAEDFEPEYIAVSADSTTAWVTLQENNAIAILDIGNAEFTSVEALGFKDHSFWRNGLDASNKDDVINIQPWPVQGMYQPDAIKAYTAGNGKTYLITANEGDARDYDGFSEETRVSKLDLDPDAFPNAEELQEKENLGRLKTTTALGDLDGDGDHDVIYSYGARSFSIWDADGELVFDSGAEIEWVTAWLLPDDFNSNNDENDSFDARSDDKGPEPESVAIGQIGHRTYAFIGLERVGGIMVYDVSNPQHPKFQSYINNRDFDGDAEAGTAGDLGPEGMIFIAAADSPTGGPLLVVANEVSGTTTVYAIAPRWDWLSEFDVVSHRNEAAPAHNPLPHIVDLLLMTGE